MEDDRDPFAWERQNAVLSAVRAEEYHTRLRTKEAKTRQLDDLIGDNIIDGPSNYITSTDTSSSARKVYDKYAFLIEELHVRQTCVACGRAYRGLDNFQVYGCLMHTGTEVMDHLDRSVWSCCRIPAYSGVMGCTPCMHASTFEGMNGTVRACKLLRVPKELVLADILPIERRMIVKADEDTFSFATNRLSAMHSAVRRYIPDFERRSVRGH